MLLSTVELASGLKESGLLYNHVCSSLSDLDMEMVRSVPPGGNWKDIPLETVQKSSRLIQISASGGRTTYYGRLRGDRPSYTINTYYNRPGNGTFIHPDQNRLISHREAARLQSFPDEYRFFGSQTSMRKQIGNAVPPLMARAIGETIKAGLVVDLFAGAGGISEGLSQAGHRVILASDINANMCETLKHNHSDATVVQSDVADEVQYESLKQSIEAVLGGRTLRLIAGGPPCQGFSTAGKRDPTDMRNSLIIPMLRIVGEFMPEYVMIENVLGMRHMQKGKVLRKTIESLESFGYDCRSFQLNAEQYGVPQKRKRLVVIANRTDRSLKSPLPSFSPATRDRRREDAKLASTAYPPPINVYEAISDLPMIPSGGGSEERNYENGWLNSDYQRLLRGQVKMNEFLRKRGRLH
ncbi:MAG: DNA (cytosine-5-)-methyltransferase [Candidatus Thorarchaeota archaeon]